MFGLGSSEVATLFLTVLVIILAVLGLLMPVFVYQIRNKTQDMSKKMDTIIRLLARQAGVAVKSKIKLCPFCNAKNRTADQVCVRCGKVMGL